MKLRIKIQAEAGPILVRMAKEAGVGVSDLAEIAVYNLIGCYLQEKGEGQVPLPNPGLEPSGQPGDAPGVAAA